MPFSSQLCNPTPFPVKLPWAAGINIKIEAFGSAELTMQQMDDFRPGKPGSAEVRQVLDYHGLFLLDTDRSYDHQALEALQRAYASKKQQYDAAVRNITDSRTATGVAPDEDALEAKLEQMGYSELKRMIDTIGSAVVKFKEVVGSDPERNNRKQLDPKRTILVLDPPREFPSVAAMDFFLEQHPDVLAKHRAMNNAPEESNTASEPSEDVLAELQQFTNEPPGLS